VATAESRQRIPENLDRRHRLPIGPKDESGESMGATENLRASFRIAEDLSPSVGATGISGHPSGSIGVSEDLNPSAGAARKHLESNNPQESIQ